MNLCDNLKVVGTPEKTIFEYSDFRELLRGLYVQHKAQNKNFSYRFFARIAGFKSAAFLKRVIDGESRLSHESIEKIAKGFRLTREESHFFKHLVLLNQSESVEERQIHANEIACSRAYKKIHPLSEAQYHFYSKWYFIPIRELVSLPGFKEDYEWIASQIVPAISAKEAKEAVDELIGLDLLSRDLNGELTYKKAFLATPPEVVSTAVAVWHREMAKKASESIDIVPREKRHLEGMTIRVAQQDLPIIKERVQKFRQEIVDLIAKSSPDTVYELNIHFFPLSLAQGTGGES